MIARLVLVTVVLSSAGLCGCSGGDSESAPDVSQPLAGKAPRKASQFEGRWVRVGEAEIEYMEFRDDGKALVGEEGAGLTVDYSVLDGGRLSLVMQGGMTTVYDATLAGDQLELVSDGNMLASAGTSRYRRLGKNETVKEALAAQARARAEAYQKRVAGLETFLAQPGLVLAFAENGPASIALEIQAAGGSFNGQAWHDDRPPHLNAISGALLLNQTAGRAQVQVTYGQRIAPPTTQADGGGQINMQVEGEGEDLRISAQVTIGGIGGGAGPAHEMVLRSDPKLHAEIVARYEAELARIEGLKQPLVALLKEYCVLRGELQSQDPRSTAPDAIELTLARDPASGEYWVEGVHIGHLERGSLLVNAGAEIAVVGEQPQLRILTPPAREYVLAPDGAAVLSGRWSSIGGNQANAARFEVVEVLDAKARDAKYDARREALRSLEPDSTFTGLAFEDSASGMQMPIAFQLELSPGADGNFTGRAHYPTKATVMTVTGKLAETSFGPRLQLSYTAAESTPADKVFLRSIQNGAWQLVPGDEDDASDLVGFFNGPPVRQTRLTQAGPESTARLRARLVDVMGGGARFHVAKFVGWQSPGIAPSVVELTFDDASGELSGYAVVVSRILGTNPEVLTEYQGELKEESGALVLELWQVSPYRSGGKWAGALKLYVAEDRDGGLHLNGLAGGKGVVPAGEPLPAFPTQFVSLVELLPVDDADPATRAVIDQAVADAELARAEADAAAEAKELAEREVRRIKLAPFLPLLESEAGLVITTGTPTGLGTVLTEVVIDEEAATVVGRGVDLREMPLRDFTFECGIDNRSNLTLTTSIAKTPYTFPVPAEEGVAKNRWGTLAALDAAARAELDERIALGKRLQSATQAVLTVEILDPETAKAREASMTASSMPGVAIYKNAKNDKVAAMFTAESPGRYRWAREPVTQRLDQPMRGQALYIKNGGPTDKLVVVVNGVHRAIIPAIAKFGAAVITLPPDLEILDLRLEAEGTAQARAVLLLE